MTLKEVDPAKVEPELKYVCSCDTICSGDGPGIEISLDRERVLVRSLPKGVLEMPLADPESCDVVTDPRAPRVYRCSIGIEGCPVENLYKRFMSHFHTGSGKLAPYSEI